MENTLLDKLNEWAGTLDVDYTHPKFGIAYCFEYIVPKLGSKDLTILLRCDNIPRVIIADAIQNRVIASVDDETPALALCRAVEKLIDE